MQHLKQGFFRVAAILLPVVLAIGCSSEARKLRLLKSGDSYFDAGEYDKAKIEYLNVLKEDPQNTFAIQRLATIWWEQGSPLQAAPFLFAARDLAPENVDVRAKLVSVLLYAGQFEKAQKEALAILDQAASHEEAMRLLVEASAKKEDLDEAERRLRTLSAHDTPGTHIALGILALRKGDMVSAQDELEQALSLDPRSLQAHLALARLYLLRGDTAQAEREFKTAAQSAPPRGPTRLAYAEFKLRTGAIEEAKLLLNAITLEAPDSLPAWRLLAEAAFTEGKPREALEFLENAILRDPTNIEARLLQAQIWLAQGEVTKATEALERLDGTYPKALVIKYQLARAYLQGHNTAKAALVLGQAISENPNYVEAQLLLGEINLRSGSAEQVVDAMTELLKQRPKLVPAEIILAQAYSSLGRFEDAATIFRAQIAANPKSVPAYLSLALILRQQRKLDEARENLEIASQLEPTNLAAVSQLVELDIQQKDYTGALRRVDERLEKSPDSPHAYFLKGKIYASQKAWDKAATALLAALDRKSDYSSAADLLISTYLAAGKFSEALKLLEERLSKNPGDIRALMTAGMIYERLKDLPRARDAYEKLISLKSDSVPALNNLAYLYAEHFDSLEKGKELAQKARALNPTDPRVADTLGWVLYKSENYQEALTLLEEATQKLPGNPEVQFHVGMARYMLGHREGAREAFLQANATPSDFPGKAEVQKKLALLESDGGSVEDVSSAELETAIKTQPNDPLARMHLGNSYEREGSLLKAAIAYEEALKISPGLLTAAVKLAQLYGGPLDSPEKAFEFAKKARDIAPNDPKVLAVLGSAAYESGDFAWAYSLLQEAARQLPDEPQLLKSLAWAAYSQGQITEAENSMRRILELKTDSALRNEAKLFLATTALDRDSIDSTTAQTEAERVLESDPNHVPALMVHARSRAHHGETEAAIAAYLQILDHFPDFAPAQRELASLYLEDPDKRDEAYSLAVKARKALRDDPEVAQILAEASYQKNEFAYAIQLLQQSANQKPLDAKQLYILGMSQFRAKDNSRSREALDKALNAGLPQDLAENAKRTLRELGNQ